MKTIILAGGFGTRLAEYTDVIPKPMVTIGGKPILWHIMNTYASFGHKDFYLALGYKAEFVKEYFLNYRSLNSDFMVDLSNGSVQNHSVTSIDWLITLVDTGVNSLTGGRVKRLQNFIGNEPFLLTYGDGVSDVNIKTLVEFHKSHGKMVTVTAVHPAARFGELDIQDGLVKSFQEKPQTTRGWINGGYFVIEPEFFELIAGDSTVLEKEPLELVAKMGELMAYEHEGFWQCMDTKRDKDYLEDLWISGNAPWKVQY
ncbi:glucose-1-phosphate cytidylyltransferase [Leptospira vanthielii]|uniref:Glucose-1-phosphate cytidylyltransferase n=1 Tax=Leptospira vanthielii serovar Holland str. Waz Holland = ATCC 700522 TaxID=1218591 RepID=N1VZJ6_9LEPT|nr:glucose-1-phosphate cytidylyltransferase [Leptospira vanthielii]EMY69399.1 glucose-1-phosphate cytidylyltransferase [Leptospira vanthielii serovar Holland str. Waz Holland = ATCC 700522]